MPHGVVDLPALGVDPGSGSHYTRFFVPDERHLDIEHGEPAATCVVRLSDFGTFTGIVVELTGIQDGLTGANSGVFLRAIGDLLDGAALAFVTSLFGLGANLICSTLHRRRIARFPSAADALLVAAFESLNPSTDAEFLRVEMSETRLAIDQIALKMSDGLRPVISAISEQSKQQRREADRLIAHLAAWNDHSATEFSKSMPPQWMRSNAKASS